MLFEDKVAEAIQKKILKEIESTSFTRIDHNQKSFLPPEIVERVWESINWDDVVNELTPKIQTRICNTIVGSMETEVKTDVKKLLSVDSVREKLRIHIYPKLMNVINEAD